MNRKDAYALIKEHDLGEEVKHRFGDNYTRVSTEDLLKVIYDFDATLVDECPVSTKPQQQPIPASKTVSEDSISTTEVSNPYEAACLAFLAVIKDSELLDDLLEKL